jgi:hypothetical protein
VQAAQTGAKLRSYKLQGSEPAHTMKACVHSGLQWEDKRCGPKGNGAVLLRIESDPPGLRPEDPACASGIDLRVPPSHAVGKARPRLGEVSSLSREESQSAMHMLKLIRQDLGASCDHQDHVMPGPDRHQRSAQKPELVNILNSTCVTTCHLTALMRYVMTQAWFLPARRLF